MAYIFKSSETGSLLMLAADAEKMLETIGKEITPKGVITVDQMSHCIQKLQEKIVEDERLHEEGAMGPVTCSENQISYRHDKNDDDYDGTALELISFKQRTWPFLEMLKNSLLVDAVITWET